jgi:hypothetical protein
MKYSLLALLCLLLCSTCRKEDNYLFTMDYELDFNIQPGLSPFGGTWVNVISDIPSRFNSYLSANGISEDQIVKITSGSARLVSQFSSSGYGFIQDIEVFISKPNDPGGFRLVFERLSVPQNTGQQVELIGSLIDSKDFLMEETFNINFEMVLRQTSPELINSRLILEFRVQTEE